MQGVSICSQRRGTRTETKGCIVALYFNEGDYVLMHCVVVNLNRFDNPCRQHAN